MNRQVLEIAKRARLAKNFLLLAKCRRYFMGEERILPEILNNERIRPQKIKKDAKDRFLELVRKEK